MAARFKDQAVPAAPRRKIDRVVIHDVARAAPLRAQAVVAARNAAGVIIENQVIAYDVVLGAGHVERRAARASLFFAQPPLALAAFAIVALSASGLTSVQAQTATRDDGNGDPSDVRRLLLTADHGGYVA